LVEAADHHNPTYNVSHSDWLRQHARHVVVRFGVFFLCVVFFKQKITAQIFSLHRRHDRW